MELNPAVSASIAKMTSQFVAVHILASDLARAVDVFCLITQTNPAPGSPSSGESVRLAVGGGWLEFHGELPPRWNPEPVSILGGRRDGVFGVEITVDDLEVRVGALKSAGAVFARSDGIIMVPESGISIAISAGLADASCVASPANHGVRLDHLALLVDDLAAASTRWEAITGVDAEQMGLHPISQGAFSASRLALGSAMIELISPTKGRDSPVGRRLAATGEGPVALAIPVDDVDAAVGRLRSAAVRVDWRDPHWMVHPGDCSGVLVQLTPRVEH